MWSKVSLEVSQTEIIIRYVHKKHYSRLLGWRVEGVGGGPVCVFWLLEYTQEPLNRALQNPC